MTDKTVDQRKSELLVAIKDRLFKHLTAKLPDMLDAITADGGLYLTPEEWKKYEQTLPDALLAGSMVAAVCELDAEYNDCRLYRKGADAVLTYHLNLGKETDPS